jgi:hypothetical protein
MHAARRLRSTARWIAAAGIGLGLLAGGAAPAAASGCGTIVLNGHKYDLPCLVDLEAYYGPPPPCICPPDRQIDDRLTLTTQPQVPTDLSGRLGSQVGGLAR